MLDHLSLPALCSGTAVFLVAILAWVYTTKDPAPPVPVQIDDRSTWRRETNPSFFEKHWVHFIAPILIFLGVYYIPMY